MSIEWLFIGAILGVPIGIVIAEIQYRWWAYKQTKAVCKMYRMGMYGLKKEEERLEKRRFVYISVSICNEFAIKTVRRIIVNCAPEERIVQDIKEWLKLSKECTPPKAMRPTYISAFILKNYPYSATITDRNIGCPDISIYLDESQDEIIIMSKNDVIFIESIEIMKEEKDKELKE